MKPERVRLRCRPIEEVCGPVSRHEKRKEKQEKRDECDNDQSSVLRDSCDDKFEQGQEIYKRTKTNEKELS